MLIEADLADRGVDVEDRALMRGRSWRWLRGRILGLTSAPPIGWRTVRVDDQHTRSEPVWPTRLQTVLYATRGE